MICKSKEKEYCKRQENKILHIAAIFKNENLFRVLCYIKSFSNKLIEFLNAMTDHI